MPFDADFVPTWMRDTSMEQYAGQPYTYTNPDGSTVDVILSGEGQLPYTQMDPDGSIWSAQPGTEYYSNLRSRKRRGTIQGAAQIAALVGGGAALGGALGGGFGGGIAGGGGNALAGAGPWLGGGGMPFSAGGISRWLPYVMEGANALLGYRAAGEAADASEAGSLAAIAEGSRQYDQTRADQMPWLDAGRNALADIQNPDAFMASPDYDFVRNEGFRDIGNQFSAGGGAFSGNALRALQDRAANLASGEYGNWFSRKLNVAGLGSDTAGNLGALGANRAANAGNAYMNAADARSSGILGQYGAIGGGLRGAYETNYLRRMGY